MQEASIYCEYMAQSLNQKLQIIYDNESFVIVDEAGKELVRVNSLEHLRIATYYFTQGISYISE